MTPKGHPMQNPAPPETPGQQMSRIIRDTPPPTSRQQLLDNIRRTWAAKKENHRG